MIHYVYKITNSINGKCYVGKHSAKKVPNNYLGSGEGIKAAVRKYGRENFIKEIISFHDTEDGAYEAERIFIQQVDAVFNPLFYNRTSGGRGAAAERALSDDHRNKISKSMLGKRKSEEARKNMSRSRKGSMSWHKGRKKSEETIARMRLGRPKDFRHSLETKKLISEQFQGDNHPAYGCFWITNGVKNRRSKTYFVLESGWRYGKTSNPYKKRNVVCLA